MEKIAYFEFEIFDFLFKVSRPDFVAFWTDFEIDCDLVIFVTMIGLWKNWVTQIGILRRGMQILYRMYHLRWFRGCSLCLHVLVLADLFLGQVWRYSDYGKIAYRYF